VIGLKIDSEPADNQLPLTIKHKIGNRYCLRSIKFKMMKNIFLALALIAYSASAFVVPDVPMAVVPPAVVVTQDVIQQQVQQTSPSQDGIRNYIASPFEESTTMTLSLKERPPPPTEEELAAKKRNFNLWFWGGGFVAPFLATFYYFGFKFWER
jgi:hypothetical protein